MPRSVQSGPTSRFTAISRWFRKRAKRSAYRPSLSRRIEQWWGFRLEAAARHLARFKKNAARFRIRPAFAFAIAFILGGGVSAVSTWLVLKNRRAAQEVVAAVAGERITAPDFYHRMELEVGPQVLNRIVEEDLVLRFAASHHIVLSDPQVRARITELKQTPRYQNNVAKSHITDQDLERQARVALATEQLYSQGVAVTDRDARAYYAAQIDPRNPSARFYTPEQVRLSIITANSEALALTAHQEIQHGASFAEVERRLSQDRTAGEGGRMFPILRGRSRFAADAALENQLFHLKPGEMLGPRKVLGAWLIFKSDGVEPASAIPFEKVREQCRAGAQLALARKEKTDRLRAEFEEFRKNSRIQVFWQQYYYDLAGRHAPSGGK